MGRCPPRIHRALLRGLRTDPAQRFPLMAELFDQLAEPRGRRWIALVATAAGLSLIGLIASTMWTATPDRVHEPPQRCPLATQRLSGVWDEPIKVQIHARFAANHNRGRRTLLCDDRTAVTRRGRLAKHRS